MSKQNDIGKQFTTTRLSGLVAVEHAERIGRWLDDASDPHGDGLHPDEAREIVASDPARVSIGAWVETATG